MFRTMNNVDKYVQSESLTVLRIMYVNYSWPCSRALNVK